MSDRRATSHPPKGARWLIARRLSLFVLALLTLASAEVAAAGVIDRGFGNDGWQPVTESKRPGEFDVASVEATKRGYLAFGRIDKDLGIFAFRKDGSLDRKFNGRGWRLNDLVNGHGAQLDLPRAVVSHGVDHFLVAGSTSTRTARGVSNPMTLSRIDERGRLDPGFGDRGTVRLGGVQPAEAVTAAKDGNIYTVSQNEFRRERKGRPQQDVAVTVTAFNGHGKTRTEFANGGTFSRSAGAGSRGFGIETDPAGRPLVLLRENVGSLRDFEIRSTLIRLRRDGSPDPSFGDRGFAERPGRFVPIAMAVLPDGRIQVAGRIDGEFHWARYRSNGELDSGYGTAGLKKASIGKVRGDRNLDVLANGRLVLGVGESVNIYSPAGDLLTEAGNPGGNWATEKFTAASDGSVITVADSRYMPHLRRIGRNLHYDEEFDARGPGERVLRFGQARPLAGLTGLPDGGLLTGFHGTEGRRWYFGLNRMRAGGSVVHSFGTGGVTQLGKINMRSLSDIVARPGGAARVVGWDAGTGRVANVGVGLDGGAAKGFLPGFPEYDFSLVVAARDGSFYAVGQTADEDDDDDEESHGFRIGRFWPNGSLDRGFGRHGFVETFFRGSATPVAGSLDARGRLTVASYSGKFARYLPDGTPDRSFGGDGKVPLRIDSKRSVDSLVTLPDGRIIVLLDWWCEKYCDNLMPLLALNENGSRDREFGIGGSSERYVGRYFNGEQMFPAGRHGVDLLASIEACSADPAIGVIRLDRTGSLDREFGGGDGLIRGIPRHAFGASAEFGVKQSPDSITVAGYADLRGRHGGTESSTGVTRLHLDARDGKTSLRPCLP